MNFLPTEEQRLAVEGFNRFLETKLRPIVQRYQPDKLIEKERMLEIFQLMLPYGMGGNGIIAEEHGGLGMPWLTYALMYEQLARVSGDVAATSRAIVDACTRANASVLCEPTTLAAVVQQQRVPFAVAGAIATALGCAALAISCIGLYGVVGFTVARRTREIGVRIALGATPRAVLRFVLDGAVRRIVLGLALGLPVCIAISALVAAQLEVIRAFDSRAYLAMPLLLALVAFVAAFVPARRAARIAPTEALREDG